MSVSIQFEDSGARRLEAFLQAIRTMKVGVGYQPPDGRQKYESGITVAKLAAVHEFGGDDLPARSFIRSTIVEQQSAIVAVEEQAIAKGINAAVEGRGDPERLAVEAMSEIGRYVVGQIRGKLKSAAGWAASLDPETAERKGHGTPLDETGLLSDALSWRVARGRAELARGKD